VLLLRRRGWRQLGGSPILSLLFLNRYMITLSSGLVGSNALWPMLWS
jgi:hypothetical protein